MKRIKLSTYIMGFFCLGVFSSLILAKIYFYSFKKLPINSLKLAYLNISTVLLNSNNSSREETEVIRWAHIKRMNSVDSNLKEILNIGEVQAPKVTMTRSFFGEKLIKNSNGSMVFRKSKSKSKASQLKKNNSPKNRIAFTKTRGLNKKEISNKELVGHYGFKSIRSDLENDIQWSGLDVQAAPAASETGLITDNVKLAQSGLAKAPADPEDTSSFVNDEEFLLQDAMETLRRGAERNRKAATAPKASSDELIFIDYSKSKKSGGSIGPVMASNPSKSDKKQILASQAGLKLPAFPLGAKKRKRPQPMLKDIQSLMMMAQRQRSFNPNDRVAHTVLNTLNAEFDRKLGGAAQKVTFIPAYDLNQHWNDSLGDGQILIKEKLNGDSSVLRGTIRKIGSKTTKIDVVLEEGKLIVDVPLIDEDTLLDFLEKEKLNGAGAFLLIDLDDRVDSVDVGTDNYEDKFFLNKNFKVVSEVEEYQYIFYVGLPPGNHLIRYLTLKDKIAQKVVHLTEGEVYFEASSFKKGYLENFLLFERNIMGKSKSELDIDEKDISYYNTSIHPKQQALNRYEVRLPLVPLGTRRYFEFNHLNEKIFFGTNNLKDLVLPSRGFIENAMSRNKLDNLDGVCMIQLNLNKRITNITADGESHKGPMNLELTYLDRDGIMNYEASELAINAFIVGDIEGVINLKVEYEDKSADYLQSYCKAETYLVEQL